MPLGIKRTLGELCRILKQNLLEIHRRGTHGIAGRTLRSKELFCWKASPLMAQSSPAKGASLAFSWPSARWNSFPAERTNLLVKIQGRLAEKNLCAECPREDNLHSSSLSCLKLLGGEEQMREEALENEILNNMKTAISSNWSSRQDFDNFF